MGLGKLIATIVVELFKAIFGGEFVLKTPPDTAEMGQAQPKLKKRLLKSVREKFGKPKTPLIVLAFVAMFAISGCIRTQTRTIYIRSCDPMQLAEDVEGVWCWVFDKDGNKVKGKVNLPEGMYVVEDRGED